MSEKEQCTLFDFMANNVGIKVLHPGGYKATNELCHCCNITSNSHVLDLACGVGSTSFFIQKNFGAKVTGIDIDETLIEIAQQELNRTNLHTQIEFKVGSALSLPFPDNSFDTVISQALFILIDEHEQTLKEIKRVLKQGGYFGSIELSWLQDTPQEIYNELLAKTCSSFIPRVMTVENWDHLFSSFNLQQKNVSPKHWKAGMLKMIETEGLSNFFRIMGKMILNAPLRKKMMSVQNTFKRHQAYLGYGIYSYRKEN